MAWVCDSPVSSQDEPPSLQSKASLPRCAVVNFRRDGDLVHVTPRAQRNTGGIAARVLKFEQSFALEELSSRTFAFNKKAHLYDHDSLFDVSALSAVAEMGFEEPPTKPSRRSTWARRLSSVLRRSTNDTQKRESNAQHSHPWRTSSLGDITFGGCVPIRKEDPRPSNASSIQSHRRLTRRRTARHEMQLFENGTVLAEPPKGRREWRFFRFRKFRRRQVPAPIHTPAPAPSLVSRKYRASVDSYVLYMDDDDF